MRCVRVLLVIAAAALAGCGGGSPHAVVPPPGVAAPGNDPLAFSSDRESDYVRRATAGLAHVLYAKSPGGITASVRRTERWRAPIAAAARAARVDADKLEALVLLESAGRPDAIAGGDIRGAAGLTQIVASTGTGLLGLHIDLVASGHLSRELARALAHHQTRRAAHLAALRRRADPRFDPPQALAATARYLRLALVTFGRADLAFESYHMGIGNLETALRRYTGDVSTPITSLVRDRGLTYARLYFDSTPLVHASAWAWLYDLGDDSATYLWRLYAARQIIALARANPGGLTAQAARQLAAGSAEVVLHPPGSASTSGRPLALPPKPLAADGVTSAAQGQALHPPALSLLGYLGAEVRRISGVAPLIVANTDPDGWTFEVSRRYVAPAQAQALQSQLDRLTALDMIAWERDPATIRVTVAGDAATLLAR